MRLLVAAALTLLAADGHAQTGPASLQAFQSDAELRSFLHPDGAPPVATPAPPPAPAEPAFTPPTSCPTLAGTPPATPPPEPVGQSAVITGRVTGPCGQPHAAVLVRIESLNVGATTGADGFYRLVIPESRITDGQSVSIAATRLGLGSVTRAVTINRGAALVQDFQLQPVEIALENMVVTGSDGGTSITNNQHAGVDEGGIVKVHGAHLVMLRRGRLFTVAIDRGRLTPVDAVDAYGPDAHPHGTWYDELLVSGDQVVVIGYSYRGGGTEIGLFRITPAGRLTHRATYHFRSDDYYSGRNYASRLIGSRLVMYAPVPVGGGYEMDEWMPAMRRWKRDARAEDFRRILAARHVYRPAGLAAKDAGILHTVTTCDLAAAEMRCEARAVLGAWGREFYVSPTSVYVWAGGRDDTGLVWTPATLYRMPLAGGRPSAMGVQGMPLDQFSFLEKAGHLNVLVHDGATGGAMWDSEHASGNLRLLRLPLGGWGDGRQRAPRTRYRTLPGVTDGYSVHNRFVGDHLLYGGGSGWHRPLAEGATLFAVRFTDGRTRELTLPHGVDRIEVMGGQAVVVGSGPDGLYFTGVRLDGRPRVAQRFVQADATQGELRSHGFFYRVDAPESGIIGLPIRGPGRPGYEHLFDESASVLFVRNDDGRFASLGGLDSRPDVADEDGCVVSCVDWYGNSRPIFLHGRIFALMGYEIVEGAVSGGRIRESRRVSFAPRAARASAR